MQTVHARKAFYLQRAMKEDKNKDHKKLINSGAEIYRACRHKTKFHRLIKSDNPCTDEGCTTCPENSLK